MSSYSYLPATPAEVYAEARHYSDGGRPSRLALATGGCIFGAMAADWRGMLTTYVVLLAWELAIAPTLKKQIDRIAHDRGTESAMRFLAALLALGSAIYTAFPAQLILIERWPTLYVSIAWLVGTLLHVVVFYSNARILLASQVAIPGAMLVLHPYAILPFRDAVLSSSVLALMTFAIVQFAIDRNNLLAAMAHRERERRAAEAANLAKSQFLANMSHELRTPLHSILGYAELIEDEFGADSDRLRADAGKIRSAGSHLLGLINEVLDFSKLESSQLKVHAEWFDIGAWAEETMSILKPLAERNSNALQLDLPAEPSRAFTDPSRLRQCLVNLAGNACKFTENGRVTISISVAGEVLAVSVTDTGIGMSPEQMGRLFTPFSQADESVSRRFGGTGLGLSITKHIAKLLGGHIEVRSQLGLGSTFTITIPLVFKEGAEARVAA